MKESQGYEASLICRNHGVMKTGHFLVRVCVHQGFLSFLGDCNGSKMKPFTHTETIPVNKITHCVLLSKHGS